MNNTTIWTGTVDNLELSGMPNGDKQPMRIVEDAAGQITTEFAFSKENENGEIEYEEGNWISDYQMRFRDMEPAVDETLRQRMIQNGLLDA